MKLDERKSSKCEGVDSKEKLLFYIYDVLQGRKYLKCTCMVQDILGLS